ncbi:MAG: DUF4102 domain-containing protein, partial [Candidatus Sericytochromatia bacterium]|nr:DUF4102 domain-containing protein [Candidatus Tanganyikabacteria bacterium]
MAENLRRFDFTMARLAALKPAKPGKRDRYWDEKVKGLTLRVTDRGAKAYYVTRWVGTRSEEIRLGAFPDLIVEAARDLAQAAIVSQVRGEDLGERKRALRGEPTFKELFDWWKVLPTKRGRKSASYIKDATWQFETYLEMWGGRKASHIKRTDVRDLHSKIGAKHPY